MASEGQSKGKKRSKAFYRKSVYGSKRQCIGNGSGNVLMPGIRGFLVMCNHDERSAVRESYNILNEYADILYGPDKNAGLHPQKEEVAADTDTCFVDEESDCDDIEKALKKEIEELKTAHKSAEKRFQNVATKSKNCVFIRTNLENPIEVTSLIMEDIAQKHLRKARYAARILPIIGTCKAITKDIEKLAVEVLKPIFSKESDSVPTSFTVLFKMRNNAGTSCGKESVIPAIKSIVRDINPDVTFSWTDFSVAIIVEVVCTVCCIGVAPHYVRLRKYNLQELQQGPREAEKPAASSDLVPEQAVPAQSQREGNDSVLKVDQGETEKANSPLAVDDADVEETGNDNSLIECEGKNDTLPCENEKTDDVEQNKANPLPVEMKEDGDDVIVNKESVKEELPPVGNEAESAP